MLKKLLIFSVALAVSITLRPIPTTAQERSGQPSSARRGRSSQPSEPPQAVGSETNRANANQQPSQPSIAITVEAPKPGPEQLKAEREASERQEATNARIADATDTIATWTIWLVLVGAAQVAATVLGFMASKKAADAARDSAGVARAALELTEGADIHLDRLVTPRPGVMDKDTTLTIVFRNYGRTRAINANMKWVYWIQSPELWEIPELQKGSEILAAQSEHTMPALEPLVGNFKQFTEAALSGSIPFGFNAAIRFDDLVGNTIERRYTGTYNTIDRSWTKTITVEKKAKAKTG
jgi:hypothetical protein